MTKTAWVFPGQGSQSVGMEADLAALPEARAKFSQAEAILGWSVLELCQQEQVNRTLYTQPCLYVLENILADLLRQQGHCPDVVAGHSLGEYVALTVAGVLEFETGLDLVKRRAELMDAAAGGRMAALMKFDREQLHQVLAEADVAVANDNSAEQIVISGTPEAVEKAMTQVKAKRAVLLNVSGAFHSAGMATPAQQFAAMLQTVAFADAKIPVLSNVDPQPTQSGVELKERLVQQMTGTVRWREIMLKLSEEEVSQAIEVGPGKVLTGLLKRTCKELELKNISDFTSLSSL
ncbi:MAG: ACP S-malonyltransferase [Cyanophyceae cyanobacterium]